MTKFEKKVLAQNKQILKNQETLIEMLHVSPYVSGFSYVDEFRDAFLEHYYKHHGTSLSEMQKLQEEQGEPHEKQSCEQEVQPEYSPIGR